MPARFLANFCPMRHLPVPLDAPTRLLRVLLAEDHPISRALAQRLLERRGHRVAWARNGAEAVRLAREIRPDVVLMDLQMPVMDGLAAMKRLRGQDAAAGRHTPVVALTARAVPGERGRLLALGMDDYLAKPFDPHELLRVTEAAAASHATSARATAVGASMTDAASLNASTLDHERALAGAQGDEALLGELASLLRGELDGFRRELRARVAAGHWAAASRSAHRIRGAVGNVQARAAMDVLRRVERACLEAQSEGAHSALDELDAELTRLAPALDRLAALGTS
jgi:two-component system sensor histidine kinase/response regulator